MPWDKPARKEGETSPPTTAKEHKKAAKEARKSEKEKRAAKRAMKQAKNKKKHLENSGMKVELENPSDDLFSRANPNAISGPHMKLEDSGEYSDEGTGINEYFGEGSAMQACVHTPDPSTSAENKRPTAQQATEKDEMSESAQASSTPKRESYPIPKSYPKGFSDSAAHPRYAHWTNLDLYTQDTSSAEAAANLKVAKNNHSTKRKREE